MIEALVIILVILSCFLSLCLVVLFGYFRENKIWNGGKCNECGAPWEQIKPPTQIYKCNCRVAAFIVKVI